MYNVYLTITISIGFFAGMATGAVIIILVVIIIALVYKKCYNHYCKSGATSSFALQKLE